MADQADNAESLHILGNRLYSQGRIDDAIAALRASGDLIYRKHINDWKTPGAEIDVAATAAEFSRVAVHAAKECTLTVIAGEEFSASEGVQVYLRSLGRAFPVDNYVLANGLSAERERLIESLGFKIAHVPRLDHLMCDRWWLYDSFIGATRYERYLFTDSRDVVFQSNPFDYPLAEGAVVLVGEGMQHRNSIWNILDQCAVQRNLGFEIDFKDWHILNGGVQYGSRKKMKELTEKMCRAMSRPITSTDQAMLNYLYHSSLKNEPGFVLTPSNRHPFCATCGHVSEGVPGDLCWNGRQIFSPGVGVYSIVHQWERTPFAKQIVDAYVTAGF